MHQYLFECEFATKDLVKRCEMQIACTIFITIPISVLVDSYGYMRQEDLNLTWGKTDKVTDLKKYFV